MWIEQSRYKLLGQILSQARLKAGLTQHALASELGKPQSFVSSYESGQRRIDVLEILELSKALGTDARKLFAEIARRMG